MNRAMLRALAVAGAALSVPPGLAAQESRPIQAQAVVSESIAGDEAHSYTLELDSAMWVFGVADQVSVDVVVTILGPDGEEVAAFDGPSVGPEYFQFDTETEGVHTVRVTAFEEGSGDYRIEIRAVERVATDPDDRLDQMLRAWGRTDGPGVLVGIVERGQLRTVRALGMANLTHGVPMTPETRSNIGSVTKQFTAMSLLLLEQDGKLSLSDDIRTHIPELPDFGSVTTLKNLLNHTGGYREVYNFLPLAGYQGEDGFRREQVIEIVQRQLDLQSAPGSEFNYNNTGYILLSMVVERVSGLSFPDFVAQRIFAPLGMRGSRVKAVQGEVIANSAQGYVPDDAGWRQARDLASSAGAGGIYSTLGDLAAYMTNYRDATVGGRTAVEAVTTRAVLSNGDTTAYGLGMGVGMQRGRVRYQHTGGDVAHRTYFGYWPELDAGVLLMSNDASFPLGMGMQIAEVYWNDRFDPDTTASDPVMRRVDEGESPALGAEVLAAYAGTYWSDEIETRYEVHVSDGALVIDSWRMAPITLTHAGGDRFSGPFPLTAVEFRRAGNGTITGFAAGNGRTRDVWFRRQ